MNLYVATGQLLNIYFPNTVSTMINKIVHQSIHNDFMQKVNRQYKSLYHEYRTSDSKPYTVYIIRKLKVKSSTGKKSIFIFTFNWRPLMLGQQHRDEYLDFHMDYISNLQKTIQARSAPNWVAQLPSGYFTYHHNKE